MRPRVLPVTALALGLSCVGASSRAEDERAQYPSFLANSYFNVGGGYIAYPFSNLQLERGYEAQSIRVPHGAVSLVLLGHHFNRYLAAELSYARPVEWVAYTNINGAMATRTAWTNLAGFSLRSTLPISGPLSAEAQVGVAIVTRRGFGDNGVPIVKDVNYPSVLFGGGLRYRLNRSWDLWASSIYSPARAGDREPHTLLTSAGFTFNMQPLPAERVEANSRAGYSFPRSMVQVGYATDTFGLGVNDFVSHGKVPIFWGGIAQVRRGVVAHYQRNVFHTRRFFSLDWGASVSAWSSRLNREKFYTVSAFPVFRFTPLRLGVADFYVNYSLAGPTSISKVVIDGQDTGKHFTFQDFFGIGFYAGKTRHLNLEVKITHYSNGNLAPQNAGVAVPLTFNLGYTFH